MAVKRQTVLVIILGFVGAGALYTTLWPASGAVPVGNRTQAAPRTPGAQPHHESDAPEVRLETLKDARPAPNPIARNLFRFKPKYVPPPAPVAAYTPPPVPSGPPPPPPVPPIGLRFIGILEPTPSTKIAILSDGRGAPITGKEGEVVLGQYRILQIHADSIEMAYLDGKGRQRIRLSGS